jgi:uncharacterized membrane protein
MQDRSRKIAVTGVLGAVTILLGYNSLGIYSLVRWGIPDHHAHSGHHRCHSRRTAVGAGIGLIFGLFSMLQAAIAPSGPTDVWFTNPLLSILPRLMIGPITWLVYQSLKHWQVGAIIISAIAGSATNTVLVLGMMDC